MIRDHNTCHLPSSESLLDVEKVIYMPLVWGALSYKHYLKRLYYANSTLIDRLHVKVAVWHVYQPSKAVDSCNELGLIKTTHLQTSADEL